MGFNAAELKTPFLCRQAVGQWLELAVDEAIPLTHALVQWPVAAGRDASCDCAYTALWHFHADEADKDYEAYYLDVQLELLRKMALQLKAGNKLPIDCLKAYQHFSPNRAPQYYEEPKPFTLLLSQAELKKIYHTVKETFMLPNASLPNAPTHTKLKSWAKRLLSGVNAWIEALDQSLSHSQQPGFETLKSVGKETSKKGEPNSSNFNSQAKLKTTPFAPLSFKPVAPPADETASIEQTLDELVQPLFEKDSPLPSSIRSGKAWARPKAEAPSTPLSLASTPVSPFQLNQRFRPYQSGSPWGSSTTGLAFPPQTQHVMKAN